LQENIGDRFGFHHVMMCVALWPTLLIMVGDVWRSKRSVTRDVDDRLYSKLAYLVTKASASVIKRFMNFSQLGEITPIGQFFRENCFPTPFLVKENTFIFDILNAGSPFCQYKTKFGDYFISLATLILFDINPYFRSCTACRRLGAFSWH
jgi:hypothetical protein